MRTWETLDGRFVSEQPEEWVFGYDSIGNKIIDGSFIYIKENTHDVIYHISKDFWMYVGKYKCQGKVISSREAYHIKKLDKETGRAIYGDY
jgi:hypothetical protein